MNEESQEAVNTEEQQREAVFSDTKANLKDFVKLANAKILDDGFVLALEDIADSFAKKIAPPDDSDELIDVQNQITAAIKAGKHDDALSLNEKLLDLIRRKKSSGSSVRDRLQGVSDAEILQAFGPLFLDLVEKTLVEYIKGHPTAVLKIKRPRRAGTSGEPAAAAEVVTFMKGKQEYSFNAGGKRFNAEIKPFAEAHAKATGNPDDAKKAKFVEDLKAGKVKGLVYNKPDENTEWEDF